MNRYVTAPGHVRAVDVGPATVIVNYRAGNVETLIGPAATWWAELAATGDTEAPTTLDTPSARALLGQLLAAKLVEPTSCPRPWPAPTAGPAWAPSWGTQEVPAGRGERVRVPLGTSVRAGLALAVVLGVLALGRPEARIGRLVRLLTVVTRRASRPVTVERASEVVHAVRWAGMLAPGRVACLEESAAVTVALAMSGHRVRWCHGAAADPVELHAWVETEDGYRVAEPAVTSRFAILRTIPE